MLRGKINVTKIAKDKMFKGEKGTYLDITLIETPNDQYGNDYMAVQDVGKEAREKGEKGAVLGNAKIVGQRAPAAAPPSRGPQPTRPAAAPQENLDEDVPF